MTPTKYWSYRSSVSSPRCPTISGGMAQAAGVLGFATVGKQAEDNKLYLFAGVDGVRFKRPVVPGDRLMLEASIDSVKRNIWRFKCRATVDDRLACEATLLCALQDIV